MKFEYDITVKSHCSGCGENVSCRVNIEPNVLFAYKMEILDRAEKEIRKFNCPECKSGHSIEGGWKYDE